MPRLEHQKHFRDVQSLPFCYVCGGAFENVAPRDHDHVPAKACFAARDRNFPLQLPTHKSCNSGHKLLDEKIGQVLRLKYGNGSRSRHERLKFRFFPPDARRGAMGAVVNVDVRGAIRQWIRGFHAALYKQPLAAGSRFAFETPFPEARVTSSGGDLIRMRLAQHRLFVECVWACSDTGPWICVFALDLYDWSGLGDINSFARRGCAGSYVMPNGTAPNGATIATELRIVIPNYWPLDPFAQ